MRRLRARYAFLAAALRRALLRARVLAALRAAALRFALVLRRRLVAGLRLATRRRRRVVVRFLRRAMDVDPFRLVAARRFAAVRFGLFFLAAVRFLAGLRRLTAVRLRPVEVLRFVVVRLFRPLAGLM